MMCFFIKSPLYANNIKDSNRYEYWINELRCPVCTGQSIAESNAKIAIAIREVLQQLIENNQTDQQIKKYFVEKYGNTILITPSMKSNTYLLWMMPYFLLVMLVGLFLFKKY